MMMIYKIEGVTKVPRIQKTAIVAFPGHIEQSSGLRKAYVTPPHTTQYTQGNVISEISFISCNDFEIQLNYVLRK